MCWRRQPGSPDQMTIEELAHRFSGWSKYPAGLDLDRKLLAHLYFVTIRGRSLREISNVSIVHSAYTFSGAVLQIPCRISITHTRETKPTSNWLCGGLLALVRRKCHVSNLRPRSSSRCDCRNCLDPAAAGSQFRGLRAVAGC